MVKLHQFFFLVAALFPITAMGTPPPEFAKEKIRLNLESEYFKTEKNFDDNGKIVSLESGRYYQNTLLGAHATYGMASDFTLLARINFSVAKSKNTDFTREHSEFTELQLGGYYLLAEKYLTLVPELLLTAPLNSPDTQSDRILTGEGAFEARTGLWMSRGLWYSLNAVGNIAARFRDGERAHLLEMRLGIDRKTKETGFGFGLEVIKSQPLSNDRYAGEATNPRQTLTDTVNAGSFRFYSVDPEFLEARAWLGFDFNTLFIKAGHSRLLNGRRTAAGSTFFVTLEMEISTGKNRSERDVEHFNIEAEKYEEELFKESIEKTPPKKRPNHQRSEGVE